MTRHGREGGTPGAFEKVGPTGELEITHGATIVYSGPFNAHFGDLGTARTLQLEVPDDLVDLLVTSSEEAREIHSVLAAASAAADETIRAGSYESIPLTTAADPVAAAMLVIETALPDAVTQRAVSASEVVVQRGEPQIETPPDGYLKRSDRE